MKAWSEVYIKDCRVVNGDSVVSPLQAYLDSMTLKGRGEEQAEAILRMNEYSTSLGFILFAVMFV